MWKFIKESYQEVYRDFIDINGDVINQILFILLSAITIVVVLVLLISFIEWNLELYKSIRIAIVYFFLLSFVPILKIIRGVK